GVGRLRLIDGKPFEKHNLSRHALEFDYLGWNKAEGLADQLSNRLPTLRVDGIAQRIDDSLSDRDLDVLLLGADVIVISTDDREAQRRVAQRALELHGIPAVLPGLYEDGGGEIFVQFEANLPCFMCWDGFRPADRQVRGATALGVEAFSVIRLTVQLCLGILDPSSEDSRFFAGQNGGEQQLFWFPEIGRGFSLSFPAVDKRQACPSCGAEEPRITGLQPSGLEPSISSALAAATSSRSAPRVNDLGPFVSGLALSVWLSLFAGCLALTFFSLPVGYSLTNGLGSNSYGNPSLEKGLLQIVIPLASMLSAAIGAVGAFALFVLLIVGLFAAISDN
ncbi:MAG: ThiF family adenylyltransferase, partial [Terriglobales bacterium]